jgi:aerobic-type carbon monoxide dehydrogenase small subunit (CoxS/CutS family)
VTDDQHGEGTPQGGGRWDPLPQGDYDDGATAFVKLPEGGIDALLASSDTPLAAPGHGYVPPPIAAAPESGGDPAATGQWAVPADGVQWPDANAAPREAGNERFTYDPPATGHWNFGDVGAAEAAPAPGHDVTGQWSIPVADGDLPDESGEFTTSSLVEQWGGTPPATLPGGAPAPWATQPTQPAQPTQEGQPWGRPGEQPPPAGHDAVRPSETGHTPSRPTGAGSAHDRPAARPGARRTLRTPERPEPEPPHAHEREQPHAHEREQPHEREPARPSGKTPAESAVAPPRPTHGADETSEAREDAHGPAEAADRPSEPPVGPAGEDGEAAGEPAASDAPDKSPALPGEEHPLSSYVLRVNGADRPVSDAWIGESLLYVLRERLGLAGAKDGCSQGECGACNVQVDGRLVASCLVPAVTAAGSEVRTVEGLAEDGQPSDVQRALARCGAVQCGFCVPGMAMTVHDLLEGNPAPTELETRQALCGNLCRCSGYRGVVDAVKEVVAEREAHGAADAETHTDEARIPHQAGPGAGGVNASAFESPRSAGVPGPHDQAYGQDGGQA